MRRLNSATAGIITAGLLLTVAACGGDDPDTGTEPTPSDPTSSSTETTEPSPTEPTTTEPATDEDKAAAALLGYLEVRDDAYLAGRVSKKLNKYATGGEHFALQQLITQQNANGITYEGSWDHEIVATQRREDWIMVTDCEDRADAIQILSNGTRSSMVDQILDEQGNAVPNPMRWSYRVVLQDGHWKVEADTTDPSRAKQC